MEQQTRTLLSSLTTVVEDEETRARYAVDGRTPEAVLIPSSEAEIAAVLLASANARKVVVPWGGGAGQDFGWPLERVDLVLSLERLNRVIDYVPADMTITVEAGLRFAELQALTARQGQTVPLDPPRAAAATIGGIVATAASGPRRVSWGGVRDCLLGARLALPDGRIVKTGGKVVKNVAGYDMPKLIAGSLGTLGIITSVSLKLRPLPADSRTLLFGFAELSAALAAAEAILNSELLPSAVAVLTPGASRRLEVPGPVSLAVALEETAANNAYQQDRIFRMLAANTGSVVMAGQAESAFWDGVRNYGDRFGACLRIRVSTVIGELEQPLQACFSQGGPAELDGIAYAPAGTALLYGFANGGGEHALVEAAKTCLAAANGTGGSAVLESAPAALRRQLDVWGPARPGWRLAQSIKDAFDPRRILNRGRFVGGI